VLLHGGTVVAKNAENHGLVVTLRLPAATSRPSRASASPPAAAAH
jgi:signal transduction histidine kinase